MYKPREGYIWNPILKFPRNSPCPCGSGKKFKKCHLNKVARAIPAKWKDENKGT